MMNCFQRTSDLKKSYLRLGEILLAAVVLSSLSLLFFGLNASPGAFEILQVPVALAQVIFVSFVVLGMRCKLLPVSLRYKELLWPAVLFGYVLFVLLRSELTLSLLLGSFWILHILFFVAVIAFLRPYGSVSEDRIWVAVGLAAAGHLFAFMLAWVIWPDRIRANILPAFDNIRHLGYLMAPAAAVMAARFLTAKDYLKLSLVCFGAATFYLTYTGSRGGVVALIAGLSVLAVYLVWHRQQVRFSRFIVLIFTTGLLIVATELLPALPWVNIFGRGAMAVGQTGREMLSGRSEIWGSTVDAIRSSWLLGNTPVYLAHIPEYQGTPLRQPHNIILQLLLHWGVLGTIIVLANVLVFARSIWVAIALHPAKARLPLTVLVTMLTHSLVDGGLFYPYSTVIAIIAFASLEQIGWQELHFRSAGPG